MASESLPTLEIPASAELVDALGWAMLLWAVTYGLTLGIDAAQRGKAHTIRRVRDEHGQRDARGLEQNFWY